MKKIIIILLAILGVGFVLYNKVYIPKTTYDTLNVSYGSMDVEVFGVGNLGAKNIYKINAQTGGRITSLFSDEGQWVKKGDLIAKIDPVDLPQLLDEAKISVKKAQSELVTSQKELDSLNAQKVLAKVTYTRYDKLKKQSYASQAEYDKAKADLDVINAQIKATLARIESAKIEIKRSKKAVESLSVKLSRYDIYAPIDGYVISKDAEVDQSVTPSQTIFEIVDPKTVWVKAYVDEKLSGDIKVAQNATIILRSQRDVKHKGIVKRIVAKSDAVTQEKEIDIAFEKLPIPFYINEQAEVFIAVKHIEKIAKIPAKAMMYENGKAFVWAKVDSKAKRVYVDIVAKNENFFGVKNIDKNIQILLSDPKKKTIKEQMSVH
jgi:RND family efflux transporter MFP subunit